MLSSVSVWSLIVHLCFCLCVETFLLFHPHGGIQTSLDQQLLVSEQNDMWEEQRGVRRERDDLNCITGCTSPRPRDSEAAAPEIFWLSRRVDGQDVTVGDGNKAKFAPEWKCKQEERGASARGQPCLLQVETMEHKFALAKTICRKRNAVCYICFTAFTVTTGHLFSLKEFKDKTVAFFFSIEIAWKEGKGGGGSLIMSCDTRAALKTKLSCLKSSCRL